MKTIIDESRDIPYKRCTDNRLLMFLDTEYIRDVCYQMFGLSRMNQCSEKQNYCKMCCRHHIGAKVFNKYSVCLTKCDKFVGPQSNEGENSKIIKNRTEVMINQKNFQQIEKLKKRAENESIKNRAVIEYNNTRMKALIARQNVKHAKHKNDSDNKNILNKAVNQYDKKKDLKASHNIRNTKLKNDVDSTLINKSVKEYKMKMNAQENSVEDIKPKKKSKADHQDSPNGEEDFDTRRFNGKKVQQNATPKKSKADTLLDQISKE